jgi:hypothetical protein
MVFEERNCVHLTHEAVEEIIIKKAFNTDQA